MVGGDLVDQTLDAVVGTLTQLRDVVCQTSGLAFCDPGHEVLVLDPVVHHLSGRCPVTRGSGLRYLLGLCGLGGWRWDILGSFLGLVQRSLFELPQSAFSRGLRLLRLRLRLRRGSGLLCLLLALPGLVLCLDLFDLLAEGFFFRVSLGLALDGVVVANLGECSELFGELVAECSGT